MEIAMNLKDLLSFHKINYYKISQLGIARAYNHEND